MCKKVPTKQILQKFWEKNLFGWDLSYAHLHILNKSE